MLKAHGVRFVFALAGGHISPILVASEKLGIRVVDTRHEATAVFAADAVSRLSGTGRGDGGGPPGQHLPLPQRVEDFGVSLLGGVPVELRRLPTLFGSSGTVRGVFSPFIPPKINLGAVVLMG